MDLPHGEDLSSGIVLLDDERIAAVPVKDCGESLVDLRAVGRLDVDDRQADADGAFARVRTGTLERLLAAQRALPSGYRLVVVEGYRPPALQRQYFEEHVAFLRDRYPTWSAGEVRSQAAQYISAPMLAPHTTGGAVDVTLRAPDGGLCWMGTEVNASPQESDCACYTSADNIGHESRAHRLMLGSALVAAGFVNYPGKWWHWSFGDRYWAFMADKPFALYGPVASMS
ncbi:D-alanyl-D-alanine dipeptidase [Thermocatellispora tengchongensis]|uniref:D-alanyl-D-alanine dipeptidase n=1 Tax=Thermocatellispora tengchongensis TaxID=1073253 RepID=A0A840PCT7_9ACTN|nr:M15 family metallopeptidase [Thermocatellispora tengchongensis]MBB5135661.1 D-alanyl-D-alanine dipeptidase [Thermocatellispora tengchongensis]